MEYVNKKKSGFTLVEMLMYALIFVIVVGGMMVFAIAMLTSSERADTQVEIADNTRFVIQKLQRTLQGATAINSPAVGVTAGTLSVNTASTAANPYIFDVVGGVLRLTRTTGAGAIAFPLTNSSVTVSSLSFQNYSFSINTKNTINVHLKIDSVEPIRPVSSSIDVFISVR